MEYLHAYCIGTTEERVEENLVDLYVGEDDFFIIYPNPTTEYIHIAMGNFSKEEVQVDIRNIDGRLIYSQAHQVDRNVKVVKLEDLSFLQPGTYVLTVLSAQAQQQSLTFSKLSN